MVVTNNDTGGRTLQRRWRSALFILSSAFFSGTVGIVGDDENGEREVDDDGGREGRWPERFRTNNEQHHDSRPQHGRRADWRHTFGQELVGTQSTASLPARDLFGKLLVYLVECTS